MSNEKDFEEVRFGFRIKFNKADSEVGGKEHDIPPQEVDLSCYRRRYAGIKEVPQEKTPRTFWKIAGFITMIVSFIASIKTIFL